MNKFWGIFSLVFFFSQSAGWAQKGNFLPIKKNYKWGVITAEGKIVLEPKYDFIGQFDTYNYAVVSHQNHMGAINEQGKIVVPCHYEQIRTLNRHYIAVYKNHTWGVVDSTGREVVKNLYDMVEVFDNEHFKIKKNEFFGVVNRQGREILQPQFEQIKSYNENYFLVQKKQKWGLADRNGNLLVNPDYQNIIPLPNGSFLVQQTKNNRAFWAVQKPNGKLTLQFEWEKAELLGNFLRLQKYSNRRSDRPAYALYSLQKDSLLTLPDYDNFQTLGERWIITVQSNRRGLINHEGKKVLNNEYSEFIEIGYGMVAFRKELRWGIMDSTGTKRTPSMYDRVFIFPTNYPFTKIIKDSQVGLLHRSGRVFLPTNYDNISLYGNSAKVYQEGSMTMYEFDENGNLTDEPTTFKNFRSIKINSFLDNEEEISLTAAGTRRTDDDRARELDSLRRLRGNWRPRNRKWYFSEPTGSPVYVSYFKAAVQYQTLRYHADLPFAFTWYQKRPEEAGMGLLIDNETGQVRTKIDLYDVDMGDFTFRPVARATFDWIGHLKGAVDKGTKTGGGAYAFLQKNGNVIATMEIEENKIKSYQRISFIGDYSENLVRINLNGRLSNVMMPRIPKNPRDSVYYLRSDAVFYVGTDSVLRCTGGKWGFADAQGKLAIRADYDFVRDFHVGRAIVQKGKKWGVINENGELVVPIEYDFIDYLPNSNFQYFLLVKDGTKYGFLDREGRTLIETNYDEIGEFSENKLRARIGEKWGYLDTNGEWLITPQFLKAQDFNENRAAVAIIPHKGGLNKRWGFIDEKGEWRISPEYLAAGNFRNSKAWVRKGFRVGFIDPQGEYVIDPNFHGATDFENGYSVIKWEARYGLLNEKGEVLIKPRYLQIFDLEKNGMASAKKKNSKIGLIDSVGNKKTQFRYATISHESEGLRLVKLNKRSVWKRKFGFIDSTGKEVIKPIFSKAAPFSEGLARVKLKHGGKWGYIDHSGNFVIPPSFEHAYDFRNGMALTSKTFRGAKQMINRKGEEVFPNYSFKDGFSEGKAIISGGNYIDTAGYELCMRSYEDVTRFHHGRAFVKSGGKWAMIDEKGNLLTSFRFDGIRRLEKNLAKVSVATLYGIADLNGQFLLPVEYERINVVAQNLFGIEKGDRIGYLNASGNWVWQLAK